MGTVVCLEEGGGMVSVQWDMGQRNTYRCGPRQQVPPQNTGQWTGCK